MLNFLIKIKPREEEKPIGRHIVKKERLLAGEKNYHTPETTAFIGSGFPIGALNSAATSLLVPALFKQYFKK